MTKDYGTEVAFVVSNSRAKESGADELAVLHLMLSRQSSRFKGVVPQPNGRWGAQIYDRNARVCMARHVCRRGDRRARRTYDVTAVRFRSR
jgi:RAV-like factor